MSASAVRSRPGWPLAAALLAAACLVLPRLDRTAVAADQPSTPVEIDRALMAEIKDHSQLMKNLQYLSDVIGPRLTGSKNAENANHWTAEKMKEYGLENVHLEAWEIPMGWQRGTARMKVVEPETNTQIVIAAGGWSPGTNGKVTGPVVIVNATNK